MISWNAPSPAISIWLSAPAKLVFAIAVAQGAPFSRESLSITVDGQTQQPAELVDVTGNRLHVLETSGSQLTLDYEAVVGGQFAPPPVDEFDLITYLRPSRYCESDTLGPTAASQFSGLEDQDLLAAVTDWVAGQLTYVPGLQPAHRRRGPYAARPARGLPRLRAPVHRPAPGPECAGPAGRRLRTRPEPDGVPRGLRGVRQRRLVHRRRHPPRPRQSLLRVATGRDAADTAFLTNFGGMVTLNGLQVTAVVDDFGTDDGSQLIQLR